MSDVTLLFILLYVREPLLSPLYERTFDMRFEGDYESVFFSSSIIDNRLHFYGDWGEGTTPWAAVAVGSLFVPLLKSGLLKLFS